MFYFPPIKTSKTLQFSETLDVKKCKGTLKIIMICRAGSRGHGQSGQRDMQVHVFQHSKL